MMEKRKENIVYELRYTDATISEICYKYGFESLPHFSNSARRISGLHPRGLRSVQSVPPQETQTICEEAG